MQPISITLPEDPTLPGIRQDFICTGFSVDFEHQRIIASLMLELFGRTETETPILDTEGEPTGETQVIYSEWTPYRRFSATNQYTFTTESNNSKFIDPQTFNLVPVDTPGAIGELDVIWSQFGPSIIGLLTMLMNRMIVRGNLNDLGAL